MRTRANLIMPGLAALTILAIVGTGIVLGQLRGGAPWVALLGSLPQSAVTAEATVIAEEADAIIVTDSGLFGNGASQSQRPGEQPAVSNERAQAETQQESAGQEPEASVVVSRPDSSEDSTGSEDSPVLENPPEPSPPGTNVTDDDAGLGTPFDGSSQTTGEPSDGTGSDETPALTTLADAGYSAQDGSATLLVAASEDADEAAETKSVPGWAEEDD